jgi:hypothetical protein
MARAPAARRPEVQTLIDAIMSTAKINGLLADAKAALGSGSTGRAADAYTQAWNLSPTRDDLGLEAAKLWIQLTDYPAAARILFAITARPNDPNRAVEASTLLSTIRPTLDQEYFRRRDEARKHVATGDPALYLAALTRAHTVRPDELEPPYLLARTHAHFGNYDEVNRWLQQAAATGKFTADLVLRDARFVPMMVDQRFTTALRNTLGAAAADEATRLGKQYAAMARDLGPRLREFARRLETSQGSHMRARSGNVAALRMVLDPQASCADFRLRAGGSDQRHRDYEGNLTRDMRTVENVTLAFDLRHAEMDRLGDITLSDLVYTSIYPPVTGQVAVSMKLPRENGYVLQETEEQQIVVRENPKRNGPVRQVVNETRQQRDAKFETYLDGDLIQSFNRAAEACRAAAGMEPRFPLTY